MYKALKRKLNWLYKLYQTYKLKTCHINQLYTTWCRVRTHVLSQIFTINYQTRGIKRLRRLNNKSYLLKVCGLNKGEHVGNESVWIKHVKYHRVCNHRHLQGKWMSGIKSILVTYRYLSTFSSCIFQLSIIKLSWILWNEHSLEIRAFFFNNTYIRHAWSLSLLYSFFKLCLQKNLNKRCKFCY